MPETLLQRRPSHCRNGADVGPPRKPDRSGPQALVLRLYIAGNAPNSVQAIANLKRLQSCYPDVPFDLQVIDTLEQPLRALDDGIRVTPTLQKLSPAPPVQVIGNLSREGEVVSALGLGEGIRSTGEA